tara:strand:- start:99 stop:443 length:345 start_codon:yes stop_codon:yes gene_type:complete
MNYLRAEKLSQRTTPHHSAPPWLRLLNHAFEPPLEDGKKPDTAISNNKCDRWAPYDIEREVLHHRRDKQLGCDPSDKHSHDQVEPADRSINDPVGDPTSTACNNAASLGSDREY